VRRDPIIEQQNFPGLFGIPPLVGLKKRGRAEFGEQSDGAEQHQRAESDAVSDARHRASIHRGGRSIGAGVDRSHNSNPNLNPAGLERFLARCQSFEDFQRKRAVGDGRAAVHDAVQEIADGKRQRLLIRQVW
jgi:hypothetical protein